MAKGLLNPTIETNIFGHRLLAFGRQKDGICGWNPQSVQLRLNSKLASIGARKVFFPDTELALRAGEKKILTPHYFRVRKSCLPTQVPFYMADSCAASMTTKSESVGVLAGDEAVAIFKIPSGRVTVLPLTEEILGVECFFDNGEKLVRFQNLILGALGSGYGGVRGQKKLRSVRVHLLLMTLGQLDAIGRVCYDIGIPKQNFTFSHLKDGLGGVIVNKAREQRREVSELSPKWCTSADGLDNKNFVFLKY